MWLIRSFDQNCWEKPDACRMVSHHFFPHSQQNAMVSHGLVDGFPSLLRAVLQFGPRTLQQLREAARTGVAWQQGDAGGGTEQD